MKRKLIKALIGMVLLLCTTTTAQAGHRFVFRVFSPEGGFNYDGIKRVLQDGEGFIWVIMDNDVYRLDGYEYKNYSHQFKEMNISVRWNFKHITDNGEGNIYLSTNNGVFAYDRKTDSFVKTFEHQVDNIRTDNRGNLWIKHNEAWNILNEQTGQLHTPTCDGTKLTFLSNLFCPYNDDLYVFSNYSRMYKYNYVTGEFNLYLNTPMENVLITAAQIVKGKLWLCKQNNELYRFDLSTSQLEEKIKLPEGAAFRQLHIDKNENIWMGTMNGLYVMPAGSREHECYVHSKANPFSIPNNSIWSISEDRQGNLWIGTFSGGLCYVNLNENNAFTSYFPQADELSGSPVSGFAEDSHHIWIATEGGGLNCYDKATKRFSYYPTEKGLASNNVKSMVVRNGHLWVSYYAGGLDRINPQTRQIKNYKRNPQNPNSLHSNNLRKIVPDGDQGLWIAYQEQTPTVSHYSFARDSFTHHRFGNKEDAYYIFDILRSGDNKLWILNHRQLYVMNLTNHTVSCAVEDSLVYLYGRTMCMDESGNIWIGTEGNGLIKYDTAQKQYAAPKKLTHHGVSTIYSMLYDGGHLWLGTNSGLIRYNIETAQTLSFGKEDGAQGRTYYPVAAMKSANGNLYFGGTNGYTVVNPRRVSYNTYQPNVIISDFLVDNAPTGLPVEDEMTLRYDHSNFGFRFSSDSYLIPEKTRYRYRLRGYDEKWMEVGAENRTALYSKVPAGTYHFEIVAANNDGVWNNTPKQIKIVRKPAPWRSLPAYIFYLLVLAAMVYSVVHYFNQQKKLKLQLYLDEIEKNKKEEIHQSQLRFFTNISHDFRTPLTLIMGVLGKLQQEGIKEYYYRILHNNAQRLFNLVNELMEFRTIENGKMSLHIAPFDLNALVRNIVGDFNDYARQRNITYTVAYDETLPDTLYIDRQIVEKVIMNLLNNAFKYTKDGGDISIRTYNHNRPFESKFANSYTVENTEPQTHYFKIAVCDTGVGISKESIQSVFERFYKVNTINTDSHLGTGIGLALVKSMVLLHKGKITIHSERDKGTDIVVWLPYNKTAYSEKDFVTQTDPDEHHTFPTPEVPNESAGIMRRNKKRILITEDNAELRGLIADFLAPQYEVVEAEDGVEATEIIGRMEIDLVISDIMMPRKDGIALSREIKENLETSHIPVVLLTAKTGIDNKIEGAGAGADIYFEKPVDFNLLQLSIENIFSHQAKLKEYYAKNYFVESPELAANEQDNKFLKKFVEIIEENINQPQLDVNFLARELSMSRSKLYVKVKALTDKSIVEFVLSYRLRKAARIIAGEDIPMRQVMEQIGIESQPYFTNAFKREFGETPSAFAAKHRNK